MLLGKWIAQNAGNKTYYFKESDCGWDGCFSDKEFIIELKDDSTISFSSYLYSFNLLEGIDKKGTISKLIYKGKYTIKNDTLRAQYFNTSVVTKKYFSLKKTALTENKKPDVRYFYPAVFLIDGTILRFIDYSLGALHEASQTFVQSINHQFDNWDKKPVFTTNYQPTTTN